MTTRKRPQALVLDHEPLFEPLFKAMMEKLNWDCEVVMSREKAVVRLNAAHFDVLVTDYHMPQGNGFHFICCLRQEGINLPAIVTSQDAQALRLTPKELLTIPAVLLKPFTFSELKAALNAALPS
jgi:CheY-like chemotaxis protein